MKKILLTLNILISLQLIAQDNNYWNQTPGTALMGGAVVGGIRSNSAVYYNPSALVFIDSNTISVSAVSYQIEDAIIKNGGGKGIDYSSFQLQNIPLVSISGIYKTKKSSKSTFGYMLFTKNQTSNSFSYRYDGYKSNTILNNDPNNFGSDNYLDSTHTPIEYIGDYSLQTSMNELCFGLGYAYKMNNHVSVGMTPIVAYRTQSLIQSFVAKAFPDSSSNLYNNYSNNNGVGINYIGFNDIENVSLYNFRMYFKFGLSLDFGNLKLGGAITTQSFNLFGNAQIARDISYSGGYADTISYKSNINPFSYTLNDNQSNLNVTIISPFSISLGVDYTINNTNLAITGEYFAPLDVYNIATPDSTSFLRPAWQNRVNEFSGLSAIKSNNYLELVEAAKSVTNIAISFKQKIDKKLFLLLSFRTDFSYYKKTVNDFWEYQYVDTLHPSGQKISFSNVDLYHYNIGIIKKNKKSDIHLGLTYTYGVNTRFQPLNNIANPLDNTNALGAIPNYSQTATYKYTSYSLILSYTYHIK